MDRQGHYRTIGRDERAYRSFVPTPLQDIHLEMDEEMQKLLAQAHERLKNRNLSDIDALQKEEQQYINIELFLLDEICETEFLFPVVSQVETVVVYHHKDEHYDKYSHNHYTNHDEIAI